MMLSNLAKEQDCVKHLEMLKGAVGMEDTPRKKEQDTGSSRVSKVELFLEQRWSEGVLSTESSRLEA